MVFELLLTRTVASLLCRPFLPCFALLCLACFFGFLDQSSSSPCLIPFFPLRGNVMHSDSRKRDILLALFGANGIQRTKEFC